MKLKLSNRKIDDLQVRVFDPVTGIALSSDAVIDTDKLPYQKQAHFMQAFLDGDMQEVVEPVAEQPAKKTKD